MTLNAFDTGLATGLDALLGVAGNPFTLGRPGRTPVPNITCRKSPQRPVLIDGGNGQLTEILMTDFVMRVSDLPFGFPLRGDTFTDGTSVWTVQPLDNEKPWVSPNPSQIRVHTKQTA